MIYRSQLTTTGIRHLLGYYYFISTSLFSSPLSNNISISAKAFFAAPDLCTNYFHRHHHQFQLSSSMWDSDSQTYVDGIVPSHHSAMDIDDLLELNGGKLKIFGYGSLCWNPGTDGVLSLANIDEDEHDHDAAIKPKRKVTTAPGRAIGYQRCWCQRSADHRGTPQFNGIVCTLLSDEEVSRLYNPNYDYDADQTELDGSIIKPSMTEGLIYTVDEDLVDDCLAELDFREKGGYARDVIDVVEDDTGNTVKALLYRGTPDNPAFWKRVLLDLPFAAAIMSVAIGPSGANDAYLFHLHSFLTHAAQHSPASLDDHLGDDRTGELARMVKLLQSDYRPYFIFGAGSNQHEQLLLQSRDDDYVQWTGMLLVVPRGHGSDANHAPKSLHAGGGHSALLTNGGQLYLWGWDENGQLGRASASKSVRRKTTSPFNVIQPLSNIKVEAVALGHTHSLIIEKDTGRLFGFGENGRGQVNGCTYSNANSDASHEPQTPKGLSKESFIDVSAGLFHSAGITKEGELVTWGCSRFNQCLCPSKDEAQHDSTVGRWRPDDGSKLVQVACGRRHTVVLDEHGRIRTLGDNKYGQLGHKVDCNISNNAEPQLVDGPLGHIDSGCFTICCGWSHILALTRDENGVVALYGWGKNNMGQLGVKSSNGYSSIPQVLDPSISIQSACCGAESSHVLASDGNIYSTGWNEHGNLAIGCDYETSSECCLSWVATTGAKVVAPPPSKTERKIFAAGGAHIITCAK